MKYFILLFLPFMAGAVRAGMQTGKSVGMVAAVSPKAAAKKSAGRMAAVSAKAQTGSKKSAGSTAALEPKLQHRDTSLYEDADKNTLITKRKHQKALPLPISHSNLTGIAKVRFKMLKVMQPGLHQFKIQKVYSKPVKWGKKPLYVWQGSYKDKKGKVHFVTEFIGADWTYNVFAKNKQSVKAAFKKLKGVLKI